MRLSAVGLLLALVVLVGRPVVADEPWNVPGTPAVKTEHVTFRNAGATLQGTLYLPQVGRPVPAVVALHAASIGEADAALYRHLREGLPAIGVAVLLFDRRGSGASTGSARSARYETLADDGIAGARAIAKLSAIDKTRIGYWGLSQGGWLASFAAERDPHAAFAISVSAPLVTPEAQMRFAMANELQLLGYSGADVAAMLAARKAVDGYDAGKVSRADAVAALQKIATKPWFSQMYLSSPSDLSTDPAKLADQDHNMHIDPLTPIERARVPVLFIFGGNDPWIPVAASLERVRTLAKTRANVRYAVIAGASHEMMLVKRPSMETDPKSLAGYVPNAPAYFTLLASWLTLTLHLDAPPH
jgi:hypothetical protein